MALRLVSLLVSLVVLGVLASNARDRLQPNQDSANTPQNILRSAAELVEQTHQLTGEYTGVGLEGDSALRLVSADASGYCLQLTWVNQQVYHLRGPGGLPLEGAC